MKKRIILFMLFMFMLSCVGSAMADNQAVVNGINISIDTGLDSMREGVDQTIQWNVTNSTTPAIDTVFMNVTDSDGVVVLTNDTNNQILTLSTDYIGGDVYTVTIWANATNGTTSSLTDTFTVIEGYDAGDMPSVVADVIGTTFVSTVVWVPLLILILLAVWGATTWFKVKKK